MKIIGDPIVGPGGAIMPFSAAVETSGLIMLSGQMALRNGAIIGDDITAQTETIFDGIEATLALSGTTLARVVRCTIWLRRPEDFAALNAVYARRFGEHRPARSTVVSALVLADALVEIEATAELR